ncbi:MAG: lactate racemase domain-containing protein [Candidatus Limnocylindrales bacterium]|jgi:hypothetical protein
MHPEKTRHPALSPEALADPPAAAASGPVTRASRREPFAEFMRGTLPRWALVRQRMDATEVSDVAAAVGAALEPVRASIEPGSRVCLAVGSRGIDRIDEVVRAAVAWVRAAGAEVFVVPAMGSHGGATPEGQLEVLASYGITPESIGCQIRSSMDTVALGEVRPGLPVFVDRNAFEGADVIVPINRVKPHTDFTGEIESGVMKMIAIGLGKQRGADTLHRQGFATFYELIPAVAEFTISKVNIPFGLALVENGNARLWRIEALPRDRLRERERELLVTARGLMARLPLGSIDVLVLDYIGKDISGLGMDSNVVGRYYAGPTGAGPSIQRIVVRDLTAETEGNAVGIGLADVVLRRAVEKMDAHKTYMNSITAKTPEGARVALTVDTDRQALSVAIACCVKVEPLDARIIRIRDTKHLELLYVSEPALQEVLGTGGCEIVQPPDAIEFDRAGMFASSLS